MERSELDLSGSEHGKVEGICICGNELSSFIKCGKFLN
jgi:hypothetical protein